MLDPVGAPPAYRQLLQAEGAEANWRLVEVYSQEGCPFEVELSWSMGGGAGSSATVTVPRATRVCVFARTLGVRVTNLARRRQTVGVTVADGFAPTSNVREASFELRAPPEVLEPSGELPVELPDQTPVEPEPVPGHPTPQGVLLALPRFARRLRVELDDESLMAGTWLELESGAGHAVSRTRLDQQPPDGVVLGGAQQARVVGSAPCRGRGVFELAL